MNTINFAQYYPMMPYNGYYGGHMWGYGFSIIGLIIMILFWVLVAYIIISLIRHFGRESKNHYYHHDAALDILKERYAKGEISKEQFEKMKQDLM